MATTKQIYQGILDELKALHAKSDKISEQVEDMRHHFGVQIGMQNAIGGAGAAPPAAPTTINPSGSWDGTLTWTNRATSISTFNDPTRTTAKPAARWYSANKQYLRTNTVYGIYADANGGISTVDFWLEGGTVLNVPLTLYADTDANGNARYTLGYFVTIGAAAAAIAHNNGALELWARVTATDGTMQVRCIGISLNVTTAAEVTYTIGTGGTYATIQAATTQMIADGAIFPKFRFVTSGTYEPQCTQTTYQNNLGYFTWEAAPGVTAVISRNGSSAFDSLNTVGGIVAGVSAWEWWPPTDQIRFKGSGIVFDVNSWYMMHSTDPTQPYWFDGCVVKNSVGTMNTNYWNGSVHPGLQVKDFSGNIVDTYFNDVAVQYASCLGYAKNIVNCTGYYMPGGGHDGCSFIIGNYEYGTSANYWHDVFPAIQVTGPATGTIVVSASASTMDCKVGGVSVGAPFPITFGNNTASSYFTMQQIVNTINAIAGGAWAATLLGTAQVTTRASWSLAQADATYNVSATPVNMTSFIDVHNEWYHAYSAHGPASAIENILHVYNITRFCNWTTGIYFGDDQMQDAIVRNNSWDTKGTQPGANSHMSSGNHCVFENNWHDADLAIYAGNDSYSSTSQNVVRALADFSGGTGTSVFHDNIYIGAAPANLPASNISVADYPTMLACAIDPYNGDFRPAGTANANKKAKRSPYDGQFKLRGTTDAIGSFADGQPAHSYPF